MIALLLAWKARRLLRRLLIAAVILALAVTAAHSHPDAAAPETAQPKPPQHCRGHDGLPDRRCTPGAVRKGVTLQAICGYGYSRSVRPTERYTERLKFSQMRAYQLPGRASEYEEDHLVPLSIGGAPRDPANLWPEPRHGPNSAAEKDQLETWAARMACGHRLSLARLQRDMAKDWTALYRSAGGYSALQHYPPGG
jgi:hypothetical protein